jgi:hypothetical protein
VQTKREVEHDPTNVEATPAGEARAGLHRITVHVQEDGNAGFGSPLKTQLDAAILCGRGMREQAEAESQGEGREAEVHRPDLILRTASAPASAPASP